MIVTCPSCSARYKINEAKVKGRGAKITCPRCSHRFVFYREDDEPARQVDPVASLDFRAVGIQWKVRSQGIVLEFHTLSTLQGWMAEGRVEDADPISYNGRKWTALSEIKDLSAHFADIHRRAARGEISLFDEGFGEEGEEDDSDAPTTIVGRGSTLGSEISHMLREAATPRPPPRTAHDAHAGVITLSEADEKTDDQGSGAGVLAGVPPSSPPTFQRGSSLPPVEHAPSAGEPTPAPISQPQKVSEVPTAPEPPKPQPEAPRPIAPPAPDSQEAHPSEGMSPAMIGGAVVVVLLVVLASLWAGGMIGGQAPPDEHSVQVDVAP
jgi:predicted Zn finger-like uncharacterized protein